MKREPQLPEFNKKKKTQIEKDIAYCIDTLGLNNGQIGEMFRACEELGNISVQYFCEEFIFLAEMDEFCLLYTSPSPRDGLLSRMPSSA